MKVWKDEGFLYNANTTEWQSRCAYEAACFRPKVLQNPTTGQYIMWMNEGAAEYSYTSFTSDSPTGPFVEAAQPVMAYARGDASYGNGDFGITIGPNGTVCCNQYGVSSTYEMQGLHRIRYYAPYFHERLSRGHEYNVWCGPGAERRFYSYEASLEADGGRE